MFEGGEMPSLLMNLGFAAHWMAAVLLYLYIRSFGKASTFTRVDWTHFTPVLGLVLAAPWLTLAGFWYKGGYHVLLFTSLAYWIMALKNYLDLYRLRASVVRHYSHWLPGLLAGTGVFFLAYFTNYVLGFIPYKLAPAIYSIAIFPVGIAAWYDYDQLLQPESSEKENKYQNLSLSPAKLVEVKNGISRVLASEKAYLKPQFSLQQLAERTSFPPHLLSHVLNQHLQTSFTQLVNAYRVDAACDLFQQPNKSHYSIAAIAFEVGFNSLSAFNKHFKEIKGLTPSAFRRQNAPHLAFSRSKI